VNQPSDLLIRPADPAEVRVLASFGARAFAAAFAAQNDPGDIQDYIISNFSTEQVRRELEDHHSVFLVALTEGVLIGYAKLRAGKAPPPVTGPEPIELQRIYLDPAWLGMGIGQALLMACLTSAAERGFKSMWLGVWQENQRAIAFYQRAGFQQVGIQAFVLGASTQTDWIMQRPVGEAAG
jgi:diamine N-acetyltransferase